MTNYLLIAILCSGAYLAVFMLFSWGVLTVLERLVGERRE